MVKEETQFYKWPKTYDKLIYKKKVRGTQWGQTDSFISCARETELTHTK